MSSEKKSKPDQLFLIVLYQETVKTSCQSLDTGGKRDADALFLNYFRSYYISLVLQNPKQNCFAEAQRDLTPEQATERLCKLSSIHYKHS